MCFTGLSRVAGILGKILKKCILCFYTNYIFQGVNPELIHENKKNILIQPKKRDRGEGLKLFSQTPQNLFK